MSDDLQGMFDGEMSAGARPAPTRATGLVAALGAEARRRRRVRAASWSASGAAAAVAVAAVAVSAGGPLGLRADSAAPAGDATASFTAAPPATAVPGVGSVGSFVVAYPSDTSAGDYDYYLVDADAHTTALEPPAGIAPGRLVAWDGQYVVMQSPLTEGEGPSARPVWAWDPATGEWRGGNIAALDAPSVGGSPLGVTQMGVNADGTIVTGIQVGDVVQWQTRNAVQFGAVGQGGACFGDISSSWLSPSGNSVLCLQTDAQGTLSAGRYSLAGGYFEAGPSSLPGVATDYRPVGWLDESTAIVEAYGEITAVDVRMDKTLPFEGLPAGLDAATALYDTATRTWWWHGDGEVLFDGPATSATVPCADPATANVATSGERAVVECESDQATWLVDLDAGIVVLLPFGGHDVTVLGYPNTRG